VTADSGDGSAGSASDAGAPGTGGGSDATTSSAASGDSTADGSSENTSTTSGSTETESATNESAGTAPESATNASPTESGQAAGAELGIEPIDATIVCEDDKPYFYNPNSVPVQITVDGPDGVETYGVGPGIDIGGPSPPSFRTPNMAPGEYTVTATLQNGTTVPVNGESTYTTTVKECPTSSFETACVDSDTTQVSFAADNLTGRHAVPVTLEVMSPTPADRQTITLDQPRGGVSSTFEVSDAGQVTVVAELQYASGPDRLNGLTVPAGTCDDTAASTATPTPTETTQQQSTPAETTGASPTPTATSTPRPTTTAQATATTTPTETDTRTTTETETQTEMETQSDTLTDTGTETEAAT
jgi:hypothetical protein